MRYLSLFLAALALASCGSSPPPTTPLACQAGPGAFLAALERAPGEVLVDGETPISDCLTEDQPAGDLAAVGSSLVVAATRLNSEARKPSDRRAAVQLGYLVGAVEKGASATAGVHAELVRRVNSAARFSETGRPLSSAAERAFGLGYEAGRAAG